MLSLRQFFSYMNDVDFPYVVLRNFDNLPESVGMHGHNDLDLLVYDLDHWREIFPEAKPVYPLPRVQHKLKIGEINIYIDVRYVGDGYYPTDFEMTILNTREWNDNGFYTPDANHFRLALAYHVVHHKNSNNYPQHLGSATVQELLEALKKSNICYVKPEDPTVGAFNQYWKGATAVVSKDGGKVVKKQTGYKTYSLIDNEYRILNLASSRHFPRALKSKIDEIEIEDCGEALTIENLPYDWKIQLIEIVDDLEKHNIQHRDIKPDNLMIKDGIIKLIDFGWARLKSDPPDSPPDCLGYPYKPSFGFDDNYSMRKILREFQFKEQEAEKTAG